jgi:hypothetical protein
MRERRNLQKETCTYCKQILLNATIATKMTDSGSTDMPEVSLYFTNGKSVTQLLDMPSLATRSRSPNRPRMKQIRQVRMHWYLQPHKVMQY